MNVEGNVVVLFGSQIPASELEAAKVMMERKGFTTIVDIRWVKSRGRVELEFSK